MESPMDVDTMARSICPADDRHPEGYYEMTDTVLGDRYFLMQGIGAGKFGKVYEARDVAEAGMPVAVKVVPRKHTDQKRAEREWVIAMKLAHPNIIRLFDVHQDHLHTYLILELATGRKLFNVVSDARGLDEMRSRGIAHQIFSAVQYCHQQGVWHRDLKLDNILLMSEGGTDTIKITDFGLSKDATMTICKSRCGTLSYMAPEVASISPDSPPVAAYDGAAVDIWSMGVILYVMRCCDYPFGHDAAEGRGAETKVRIIERIVSGQFKNPELFVHRCSTELQSLVLGMLTVEPERRYGFAEIEAHPWH